MGLANAGGACSAGFAAAMFLRLTSVRRTRAKSPKAVSPKRLMNASSTASLPVLRNTPGFRGLGERRQWRGRFLLGLGRPEIEIGAAEIAIGGGRLRAAGRGLHAVAHLAEQEPDFEPRLLQMLQERGGERAVLALAIVRDIVLARGVGDQLVAFEQGGLRAGRARWRVSRPLPWRGARRTDCRGSYRGSPCAAPWRRRPSPAAATAKSPRPPRARRAGAPHPPARHRSRRRCRCRARRSRSAPSPHPKPHRRSASAPHRIAAWKDRSPRRPRRTPPRATLRPRPWRPAPGSASAPTVA